MEERSTVCNDKIVILGIHPILFYKLTKTLESILFKCLLIINISKHLISVHVKLCKCFYYINNFSLLNCL